MRHQAPKSSDSLPARSAVTGGFAASKLAVLFLLSVNPVSAQDLPSDCGTLTNGVGPYDYTDPLHTTEQRGRGESALSLVTRAHFTAQVENLVHGESAVSPLGDLDFTLRVFPNHHRALYAMARFQLQNPGPEHKGRYTVECWFMRAIVFRPADPMVRVIYGIFLARNGKSGEAVEQYKVALRLGGDLPESHYNIGLAYSDLKQYDLAYEHAVKAYELGYPLPGLRNRLVQAGVWQESENE